MEKPKRDMISRQTREQLLANRHGKLTTSQWWEMISEPLLFLLVLLIPGILLFGYVLVDLLADGLWTFGIMLIGALGVMLGVRARRYARMPVEFAILYGGNDFRASWMFWKARVLYDDTNRAVRFAKTLTPLPALLPGKPYLVYYLNDAGRPVLLSIAPADHPDAANWQPSAVFQERLNRRRN